jgi:16S rRNA (uracil1498-N3)-methyltransferase
VGPEGDFTSAELAAITRAGAQPVSLGPRVLRCDTAALWCLAVLNYAAQAG